MPTLSTPAAAGGLTSIPQLMVPLEQHAAENLKCLRATSAFLRDLQSVQDKYALECSKLPFAIPCKLQRRLLRDQNDNETQGQAQPLGRVAFGLEAFVRKHNEAKTRLAKELAAAVVTPMDAFLDQQAKQTTCLLMEIAQALQNEQEHQAQAQYLSQRATATPEPKQSGSNQSEDVVMTTKDQKQQSQRKLKAVLNRREHERAVVKERLDELHLVEQQQLAVTNNILERVIESYNRLITQTTSLIADLQATLTGEIKTTQPEKHDDEGAGDDEQSWKTFLKQCERHVAITEWLNGFFTQLFSVEENMIKRLQAMLKLHPNSDVFIITVPRPSTAAGSAAVANRDGASVPVISDLMHFHKLLTVNLMDPIGRTLRFSKQKQDKIRQELLASLDETAKLVQHTRKQVKERELKHLKALSSSSSSSAAVAPSGSHGVGVGAHHGDAVVSVAMSFSGHVADAMRLNLSNFGLRSAVVTMSKTTGTTQGKPRTSLTDDDDAPRDTTVSATAVKKKQAPLTGVEKELNDARVYLLSLQRNEVEQRREIVKTLRSTSLLGVKTMELMVHDYLKHVGLALRTLKVCVDKYDAMRAASAVPTAGVAALESSERRTNQNPSKWHSFIRFPSQDDDADLKKTFEDDDVEDGPEQDHDFDESNQVDDGAGRQKQVASQLRRRAAKLSWVREANLVQEPRSKTVVASVKSQGSSSSQSAAAVDPSGGHTTLDTVRLATAKMQRMLKNSLERVFGHVFQSELSTLLAFTAALAGMAFAALCVWLHLARLQQSWEDIAALQHSNAVDFERVLQLIVQCNQGTIITTSGLAMGDST